MDDLLEYFLRMWQGHIVGIQILVIVIFGFYLFFAKRRELLHATYNKDLIFYLLVVFAFLNLYLSFNFYDLSKNTSEIIFVPDRNKFIENSTLFYESADFSYYPFLISETIIYVVLTIYYFFVRFNQKKT